ncbi:MAG: CinA family protein [Lachnospiraceae bacterium]|nr:CinA family protein [Lachnospiraceae bacterium]
MTERDIRQQYRRITEALIAGKITISTMESCTGGLLASLLTDTEGASGVFSGGWVTYSNEAKIKAGVPEEIIEKYGVYSEETAVAMANACKEHMEAKIGIGVTGSLGNVDPANADSVPGEVYFALVGERVYREKIVLTQEGSRYAYKLQVAGAIGGMLDRYLVSMVDLN